MSIKLNGATSGSVELDVPAAIGSDLSVTIPATAGDIVVKATDGSVDLGAIDIAASAPADSVNIDSSGRLLVGTSTTDSFRISSINYTPGAQVKGTFPFGSMSLTSPDDGGVLWLAKSNTLTAADNNLGIISFNGSDGTNILAGARIQALTDGACGTNDLPTKLVFSTTADGASSPTERMRIDNNGNTSIKTNGTERFLVNNNGVYLRTLGTTAAAANINVWTASSPTNLLLRSTSSLKYKTQIETLEDAYSEKILNIRPVWFRSTSEADNPDHSHWGFIAEEVAEIDPRLCFFIENENGDPEPDGVQYDRFVPHLLNLIKRQKEQIEAQGTAIAALEARLTALEGGAS